MNTILDKLIAKHGKAAVHALEKRLQEIVREPEETDIIISWAGPVPLQAGRSGPVRESLGHKP